MRVRSKKIIILRIRSLVPYLENLVLHHPELAPVCSPAEHPVAVLVVLQLVPVRPVVH